MEPILKLNYLTQQGQEYWQKLRLMESLFQVVELLWAPDNGFILKDLLMKTVNLSFQCMKLKIPSQ